MIKLVICDADGTLFCNEKYFWKIENAIAESFGVSPVTHHAHRLHWYTPTKERLALTYPTVDSEVFYAKLMETLPDYIEKRKIDAISDNNVAVLETLRQGDVHLALLTSRNNTEMIHLLSGAYRLDIWFEKIYHCDNVLYVKPDPGVFDLALEYFNVQPAETVYIGDLETDGLCAKNAGLKFVAMLEEGIKTKKDFEHVPVDFFALTFSDILHFVQ